MPAYNKPNPRKNSNGRPVGPFRNSQRKPAKNATLSPAPKADGPKESFNIVYIRHPDKVMEAATGKTLLLDAILTHDLAMVDRLLQSGANINKCDKSGMTPMHAAALAGETAVIEKLAAMGAQVNPRDKKLKTPLFRAIENPAPLQTLQALLKIGGNPDLPDETGGIPLHAAAGVSAPDVITLLARASLNPNRPDEKGAEPLLHAAEKNTVEAVRALIEERVPVLTANLAGDNCLHLSAARPDHAVIDYLLSTDASLLVNAVNLNGQGVMNIAVRSRDEKLVRRLALLGADVNAPDNNGLTPLIEAAAAGDIGIAKILVSLGADAAKTRPVSASAAALTPLTTAIRAQGSLELAILFLEHGANPSTADKDGTTPLMAAAAIANEKIIAALQDAGAEAKTVDAAGKNVLHHASAAVPIETLRKFVANGADINQQDTALKRTPLIHALAERKTRVARAMIEAGANLDTPDHAGISALSFALRYDQMGLVYTLLEKGANPNVHETYSQVTPLHIAAHAGMNAEVDALLKAKAEPNGIDYIGRTPLHAALHNGAATLELIQALVKGGCDPTLADINGTTPFDLAFEGGRDDVMNFFRDTVSARGTPAYTPKKPVRNWYQMGF